MAPGASRLAIIGGDSLIGKAWRKEQAQQGIFVSWTSRRAAPGAWQLDLNCSEQVPWQSWQQAGCTHVLICAALTSIAACEAHPEHSRLLNLERPLALAQAARDSGLTPILFSTDYVFAGRNAAYTESDDTLPLNVYGRHKAELEARALAWPDVLMLRLSKVYTTVWGDGTLLADMAMRLASRQILRVAVDQGFTPLWIADLLTAIKELMLHRQTGLFNLAGNECWSRSELAKALASALNLSSEGLEEIRLDDLEEPFRRPGQTFLSNRKLREALSWSPQPVARAFESLAASRIIDSPPSGSML